ncbi:hypothetical protein VitviT2T_022861 [Vitis vinifera]|uniref:Uncharacterized protein n=1 Tax=Vitis vinifera TaxID=29760 RepID=A0ABY9DD13_VITVI|nr:hypothetical protein VitviT2T_022861 [Vitis vinifera]
MVEALRCRRRSRTTSFWLSYKICICYISAGGNSIQFSHSPDYIVIESLRSIDLKNAPNVFMPYREAKHINEDIVKRRTSLISHSSLLVRFNTSQSFLGALSSQLPNELINLPVTVTGQKPMKFPSPQASG